MPYQDVEPLDLICGVAEGLWEALGDLLLTQPRFLRVTTLSPVSGVSATPKKGLDSTSGTVRITLNPGLSSESLYWPRGSLLLNCYKASLVALLMSASTATAQMHDGDARRQAEAAFQCAALAGAAAGSVYAASDDEIDRLLQYALQAGEKAAKSIVIRDGAFGPATWFYQKLGWEFWLGVGFAGSNAEVTRWLEDQVPQDLATEAREMRKLVAMNEFMKRRCQELGR
jgi:hypothetical protein